MTTRFRQPSQHRERTRRLSPVGQTFLPFESDDIGAVVSAVDVAQPPHRSVVLPFSRPHDVDVSLNPTSSSLGSPCTPAAHPHEPEHAIDTDAEPAPAAHRRPSHHDFTIVDGTSLTRAGSRRRIEDNLAAIRLLKRLHGEARSATPDEQHTLARYVGWGASDLARIVGAADPDNPRDQAVRAELQALLTPEEFSSVRGTILNAHYSFVDIPCAMWRAVEHLGFAGGRVLEPSMGVGHFFGTMPPTSRSASHLHGVEIDPITAGIAQHLYPSAHIQATPFESAKLPPDYFDLAIGNVPFGHYGIADPTFQSSGRSPLARSIHNYFFAKTLDLLHPGGVLAFITSRYTMDAKSPVVRRYLASQADFLGAVRLPRQALALAGSEVVTDIVVLRKRAAGDPSVHVADWIETDTQELAVSGESWSRATFAVNQYFLQYPQQVIGAPSADGRMRGRREYTVDLSPDQALVTALDRALEALPAGSFHARSSVALTAPVTVPPATSDGKLGEFSVDSWGRVNIADSNGPQLLTLSGTARARIQRFVALRDAYRTVLAAMMEDRDDAYVTAAQQSLRKAYDTFIRSHGTLNSAVNRRTLADDPESARLFALEEVDWVQAKKGGPRVPVIKRLADIFTTRTVSAPQPPASAASARDALVQSLMWKGRVDLAYMARLCGVSTKTIVQELDGVELFRDPLTETWTTRDEFLSGDVVAKLEAAEARAATEPARWQASVEALRAVQPSRIESEDIDIRLGSAWVPADIYQAFAAAQIDVPANDIRVQFINTESLTRWTFGSTTDVAARRAMTYDLNIAGRTFFDLMAEAANLARPEIRKPSGADPTVTVPDPETTAAVRESIRQVDERFRTWWREDPDRATRLTDLYNRTFNRMVLRVFDGRHLTLPGSNPEIVLRPHQKAVIWRILQSGNTLMAHCVGAGKTFALIGAAMEMRRLGIARKPLITIPNHLLESWRKDILRLYPAAKVLVPSPADLMGPAARQRFMGRIAAGDWDIVLLTHSAFERVPVSKVTFEAFIAEQVSQLETYLADAKGDHDKKTAKQIEAAIKRLEDKLVKRSKQWEKDQVLTFEELGVDALLVDEAHLYKNLFFHTKLHRVAGLSQSESDRAVDMFLKVRHMNRVTRSRGVVFATGTPISNAVSELFTMMRYLAMDQLAALGLVNFDAWKQQFADVVDLAEPAPEGGYRTRARLRTYTNVGELITLFRRFADVLTIEDLQLPVPKIKQGRPTLITTDPPPSFEPFLDRLRERVDKIRHRLVDPTEDNMLKVTSEAAAAAVDMRLIDADAPDDANGRIAQAADRIAAIYYETARVRGTQIVFLDIGIPAANELTPLEGLDDIAVTLDSDTEDIDTAAETPEEDLTTTPTFDRRNLYEDLRQKLVARGVTASDVAFIHQARNDVDKKRLFEALNAGRIRVLVASSSKGGVGMNVQRRLVALHHLDVPWRPADLEQREGRIVRQGNIFFEQDPTFEVEIFRYVTRRSFDAYRWGLLATKQTFISQLLGGKLGLRTFEDTDASQLSFEEAAAAASGDPRTMELMGLRQQLGRLEAKYTLHQKRVTKARSMVAAHQQTERTHHASATKLPAFAEALDAWNRRVVIGTRSFSIDDAESRAALREALVSAMSRTVTDAPYGTSRTVEVATVGEPYTITVYVSCGLYDHETCRWRRGVTLQLQPQTRWADLRSVVAYAAPTWDITAEPNRPPDVLRSFDTRWKTSTWLTDLATQFERRASEAAEAREREQAIASRPFAEQAVLDSIRARVRELEQALQVVEHASGANVASSKGDTPACHVDVSGVPFAAAAPA